MLYQNSLEIKDENARKYGCFVRSLLRVPEVFSGSDFNAKELNALFERVRTLGYCNEVYKVEQPGKIVEEGFRWRDTERDCFQTGIHDLKGMRWWNFAERDKAYQCTAFIICKGQTVRHHPHFRLADDMGIVIFDPYYPKPFIQYEIYRTYYWLGEAK